jgi:aryl-alcohol dehydrogenase-like predicted oxidoreductase
LAVDAELRVGSIPADPGVDGGAEIFGMPRCYGDLACSNFTAWQMAKALGTSARLGLDRFVAYQGYYSLVGRQLEWDVLPACADLGVGALVWSPLAGGLLSGKFTRDTTPSGTRRSIVGDLGVGPVDLDRAWEILDVAREIAHARDVSIAQVALNWVRAHDAVTSVILGARTIEQLQDNLAAAAWSLDPAERSRLDAASTIDLPYPQWFQHQFTAERHSPAGAPDPAAAHQYGRTVRPSA